MLAELGSRLDPAIFTELSHLHVQRLYTAHCALRDIMCPSSTRVNLVHHRKVSGATDNGRTDNVDNG